MTLRVPLDAGRRKADDRGRETNGCGVGEKS